jgi:hypothetical protein
MPVNLPAEAVGAPPDFVHRFIAQSPSTAPATQETDKAFALVAPAAQPVKDMPATAPSLALLPQAQPISPLPTQPVMLAHRPAPRPMPLPPPTVTDAQIEQAIRDGAEHLLGQFSHIEWRLPGDYRWWYFPGPGLINGPLFSPGDIDVWIDWKWRGTYMLAANAFAVEALVVSGKTVNAPSLAVDSPMMGRLLDKMKEMEGGVPDYTFENRACRLAALLAGGRRQDRDAAFADAIYLLRQHRNGSYRDRRLSFPLDTPATLENDLFNHWATGEVERALWMAGDQGLNIHSEFWKLAREHWTSSQLADGSWDRCNADYSIRGWESGNTFRRNLNDGQVRYTLPALASLFGLSDYLDRSENANQLGRDPFWPPVRRGLAWLEQGDRVLSSSDDGFPTLGECHNLADLGRWSGLKYIGSHDWYREMAARLVFTDPSKLNWARQADRLLFLCAGRPPIMMNKLRTEHVLQPNHQPELSNIYWNNRPRDLANLSRWASHQLEREVGWQIVTLDRDWSDWTDSPVLYLASHRPMLFNQRDIDNLRSFAQSGGMIFTQADGDDPAYRRFVADFAAKLFPQYPLQPLPPEHPLYSVNYNASGMLTPLQAVTNGSRILLLYSPRDIAQYWNSRDMLVHRTLYELGTNIFLYAGGKHDLRNRLQSWYIPAPVGEPSLTIPIARLRYKGNWDPEPGAYFRFRRLLQTTVGYDVDVQAVGLEELQPGKQPLAHLTGTDAYVPSGEELLAIKNYVEAGGVMLIDSCGGSSAFATSMRTAVGKAFKDQALSPLQRTHKLMNASAPGMYDLTNIRRRAYVTEQLKNAGGGFEILHFGKGCIIFSEFDLTSGLLAIDTWGIRGYAPDYCGKFMTNLLLWTLDGHEEQ